jgi:hypothetical protein
VPTLSNTITFSDQTYASLGVTPGTYTWTLNTDIVDDPSPFSDSIILNIQSTPGPVPVPEPASAGLSQSFSGHDL